MTTGLRCFGAFLFIANLFAAAFPGFDLATIGFHSTQPLFDLGQPWRLLPLIAFLTGMVAGGGWLTLKRRMPQLTVIYTLLLTLTSPLWAQQLCVRFDTFTSQPVAVQPVLLICLGALAFTQIDEAAYECNQSSILIAPSQYFIRIAVKVSPTEATVWAQQQKRARQGIGDSKAFLASLGVSWQPTSTPMEYHLDHGWTRVYLPEEIILIYEAVV